MTTRSTSKSNRRLYGAAFLSVVAALSIQAPPAAADHAWTGPWLHLNNIHTSSPGQGPEDEEICVQSLSQTITSATGRDRVKNAFWNTGFPRWDGLQKGDGTADWRVDLYVLDNPCTSYDSTRRSQIEAEFWWSQNNGEWANAGWTGVPAKWCSENFSCVQHANPVWRGGGQQPHTDYEWYYVYLDKDVANDHNINHEMGHVLGLKDGDYTCPDSIMHDGSYGCGNNRPNPSTRDIDRVRWVVNQ